jgi:hypothetical protein
MVMLTGMLGRQHQVGDQSASILLRRPVREMFIEVFRITAEQQRAIEATVAVNTLGDVPATFQEAVSVKPRDRGAARR